MNCLEYLIKIEGFYYFTHESYILNIVLTGFYLDL